jgi:protoheme IX farnesyltransferase
MELGKVRITFFVAISGSVGYILAANGFDLEMLLPVLGIFILSVGSAAFNHYQEIDTDSLMDRTKNRPLPAKKISKDKALLFSVGMSISGLLILMVSSNSITLALGVLALIWYNIIYTPLKKRTPLAIMPGALVGALPPAIGWTAAGGSIMDPQLWIVALFFFIWQIPHFWFLLLIFDDDYQKAGFPTLTETFSDAQLTRISYVWVVGLAAICMLIPLFGVTNNLLTNIVLFIAGILMVYRTGMYIRKYTEARSIKLAFLNVNIYVLIVVFLLSVDQFLA